MSAATCVLDGCKAEGLKCAWGMGRGAWGVRGCAWGYRTGWGGVADAAAILTCQV